MAHQKVICLITGGLWFGILICQSHLRLGDETKIVCALWMGKMAYSLLFVSHRRLLARVYRRWRFSHVSHCAALNLKRLQCLGGNTFAPSCLFLVVVWWIGERWPNYVEKEGKIPDFSGLALVLADYWNCFLFVLTHDLFIIEKNMY